jgi:hypothetical protein
VAATTDVLRLQKKSNCKKQRVTTIAKKRKTVAKKQVKVRLQKTSSKISMS